MNGVENTNGITVNGKVVTLTATNLNKKNVTVDGGYQLALDSNIDTTKEDISEWVTLKSGNVAYKAGGAGEYYSLNSEKTAVTYNATVAGTNSIEFSGVKGIPTLNGNSIELTANNFASNVKVVSNAGNYSLALSGNFKNETLTATANADTIKSSGSNLVISGGKGNDQVTLGKNNTFVYAKGDGNDILYNFNSNDKIKLTSTTKAKTSTSGNDFIVTTDRGKITVKNAAKNNVKIVDANDKVISSNSTTEIVKGNSVTLTSGSNGTFNAKNFTKVDGSKATSPIKIIGGNSASTLSGGAKNDSITGGKASDKLYGNAGNDNLNGNAGNDKLWGNAGNDKIYGNAGNDSIWGNDGKDTFIYAPGDGKDIIYDFEDDDMLKITGKFSASYDKQAKEIYFDVGSTANAITLKDFSATSVNVNGTDYKIQLAKRR